MTQIYANQTDIATSGAVIEIKFAYIVVFLALSVLAPTNLVGFFVAYAVFSELKFETSIEATSSIYSSIGWILLIEITLFTGFLATAAVDLISVLEKFSLDTKLWAIRDLLWVKSTRLLGMGKFR